MNIGKDADAGKDGGQEEKRATEDEMVGWHHRLNGHEFEKTPGVGDEQGGLVCCSPWYFKESDTTERLNWTELILSRGFDNTAAEAVNWTPCPGVGWRMRPRFRGVCRHHQSELRLGQLGSSRTQPRGERQKCKFNQPHSLAVQVSITSWTRKGESSFSRNHQGYCEQHKSFINTTPPTSSHCHPGDV